MPRAEGVIHLHIRQHQQKQYQNRRLAIKGKNCSSCILRITRHSLDTAKDARPRADRQWRRIKGTPPAPLVIGRNKAGQGLRGRPFGNCCTLPKNNSNQINNNTNATKSPLCCICANFTMRAIYRQDASTAMWLKANQKQPCCDACMLSHFLWHSGFQVSTGSSERDPSEPLRLGCFIKCRSSLTVLVSKAMGKEDQAGLVESIRSRK